MEAFLVSLSGVAIAEIGDRTQLLALILAARYRKPWPIIAGVLCATLLSHGAAAWIGARLGGFLQPALLDGAVGGSMIVMSLWALRPDKLKEESLPGSVSGVFLTTLVAYFVAELGDKTQIAALALGAAYANLGAVIAGATTGMMIANVPVIFLGSAFAGRLPIKAMRIAAAVVFMGIGLVFLWRAVQFGHTAS
jgi:putative Ca2+/H+ antiporter (TMEM165/GDT1 family)